MDSKFDWTWKNLNDDVKCDARKAFVALLKDFRPDTPQFSIELFKE